MSGGAFLTAEEWEAVALSARVALAAVAMTLPFGLALGWLLARKRFPGKILVEAVVNLPLVLPPVVTGWLLLVAFGRGSALGRLLEDVLGIRAVFSWVGAAIAAGVVAFPLMVRSIRLTMGAVDPRLQQAAHTLGAGRLRTFFAVTLPLASSGVIAGCVLAFARSLGEFGATIMIAGSIPGETRTVPLFIYVLLESPGGEARALRLVIVSILLAIAALIAGELLERRALAKAREGSGR